VNRLPIPPNAPNEASVDNSDELDALFAQLEAELTTPAPLDAPLSLVQEPELQEPEVEEPDAEPEGSIDQREATRHAPGDLAGDVRVTVRGAAEARAINVSETGVLAETTSRLRPGTVVELVLTLDGARRMLRATIVRSMVHSLNPTTFRTAFKFEERTTLPERR
jgi:hypothetical protein